MFLTKRPNGYYALVLNSEGKRRYISTRVKTKAEALRFLKEFDFKKDAKRRQVSDVTLSQFVKEFLEYSATRHAPNTTRTAKTALKEFSAFSGDVVLAKISLKDVERFFGEKAKTIRVHTLRKYHVTLSSVFQTACRWQYVDENVFRLTPKPKLPDLQPAYFTRENFTKLLDVMEDDELKELVYFALFTGMRVSEIVNLTWPDVDLERRVVHVRNTTAFHTKSKRNRTVPMNDYVWQMLMAKSVVNSQEYVFHRGGRPFLSGYVSHAFKKCLRKAGLSEELHFHSLRHTFASWLAQDGASLYEIQKLLGHADVRTAMVYSHLQPEQLHKTVNRIQVAFAVKTR